MLDNNQNIHKKIYEFSMRYCVALWVLIATCLINQSIFAVTFDSTPPTARFEVTELYNHRLYVVDQEHKSLQFKNEDLIMQQILLQQ